MRVLKKILRGDEGEISLFLESIDDLWHLKYLISPGDLVFALTHRKSTASSDKLRPEKRERRPVRLGVRVESVEFHIYSNWLRVHGVIESGQDVGSYHTLNLEPGTNLSIIKRWRPDELDRIKEAVAEARRPKVVLALVEEGEATIGVLRQFGIETVSEIRMGSGKGADIDRRSEFLDECGQEIDRIAAGGAQVILAGPGFIKEDLKKSIGSSRSDRAGRLTLCDASSVGVSGFQEVLRQGTLGQVLENSRLAQEAALIDELFKEIATEGKAAYGCAEVDVAMGYGAVETLMVQDELVRDAKMDALMRKVRNARGRVVIFSSEFEPGARLKALGGVAALLRFKIMR